MDFVIDQMNPGDWEQVRSIFREGIATGSTTFETDAPSWETWDAGHLELRDLWRETETRFGLDGSKSCL